MPRYLLYFSYIGTHFKGSQRQLLEGKLPDPNTIQGLLECALMLVWTRCKQDLPRKTFIKLSSRTDAKVHAFVNTAHFEMSGEQGRRTLPPEVVTIEMNKAIIDLRRISDLCISRTRIVPNDFHSRFHVRSRSYMYRLAVADTDTDLSHCRFYNCLPLLPVVEQCRCHVVPSLHFDFGAFYAALQLYRGTHNFYMFSARSINDPPLEGFVKNMQLQVLPGQPFLNQCYDPLYEKLTFYEIHFQARSFLYKQLRFMIGAAIAVGQGKMSLEKLRFMLESPKECMGRDFYGFVPAPPDALFLMDVRYNHSDLELLDVNSETRAHDG